MTLLVDTSVWSLALRRDAASAEPEVLHLKEALLGADVVVTTGLVVQELLQGFAGPQAMEQIIERFAALPLIQPTREDQVEAATGSQAVNVDDLPKVARCVRGLQAKGISASTSAERAHATWCSAPSNGGIARLHAGRAIGQRLANAQPEGGDKGEGNSPCKTMRWRRCAAFTTGVADSKARV